MLKVCRLNIFTLFWIVIAISPILYGEEERHPAMPLLDAPINATWAANHAEEWREKGFRGFLFEGILDDLRLFPSEREQIQRNKMRENSAFGEENTAPLRTEPGYGIEAYAGAEMVVPAYWDELITEIGGACNRLKAAGLDRNFLKVSIAPDEAWFTDDAFMAVAEQRFRLAGRFCKRANLRGIAIDTQNSGLIYDFLWDGYPPDISPELLAQGAYMFGLRVLRAFIGAFPSGEILLLTGDVSASRPLWFDMMEGMRDARGAAVDVQISLALTGRQDLCDWTYYKNYPETLARLLSKRASRAFQGEALTSRDILFSFEPVYYEGDVPTARYPLEAYRAALYAAALYGGNYVMICAPRGGWWQIPPDMVEQFHQLKQGGAARVQFAPPVPRTLDGYAPGLLCADATYIGSMEVDGHTADVMKDKDGAALLVWAGTSKELIVSGRTNMIRATPLSAAETQYFLPRDGATTVPALPGPVYITGMPLKEYALPAAMRLSFRMPVTAGVSHTELGFGILNPLEAPLRGSIALVTDARYAVGEATSFLNVAPGKQMSCNRTLRGISRYGTRPEFQVNLTIASDPVVTRRYATAIAPEEHFITWLDGEMSVAPVFWQRTTNSVFSLLFWCDSQGRLECYDPFSKKSRWYKRLAGSFSQAPVLVEDDDGDIGIVVVSDQGRLRLFDPQGKEELTLWSEKQRIVTAAAFQGQPSRAGKTLITGDAGDQVSLYDMTGRLVNRIGLQGPIIRLLTERTRPEAFFVVLDLSSNSKTGKENAGSDAHDQACLTAAVDVEGNTLWEKALPCGLSSAVLLPEEGDGARLLLFLGDVKGDITCLDTQDGAVVAEWKDASGSEIRHLAGTTHADNGYSWIFYTAGDSVCAQPVADKTFQGKTPEPWRLIVSHPTALTALPRNEGVISGTAGGDIYTLDPTSALLWEDHGGTGAITSLAVLEGGAGASSYICVAADAGHAVRGLNVRRDLLPEAPLRFERLEPPQ